MLNPVKKILFTSVTSLLFSTNVLANGAPPMPEAQPAPVACTGCGCPDSPKFIKTGFYGGLEGGYQYFHSKFKGAYEDIAGVQTDTYSTSGSKNGILGGAFVGGRYLFSNCMVTGFEVASVFNTNDPRARVTIVPNPNAPGVVARFNVKVKREYGIIPSFVVGRVFGDRFLAYGKAGLAISDIQCSIRDLDNDVNYSKSKIHVGFAPSLGLEYAITTSMSARIEMGGEFYGKAKQTARLGGLENITTKTSSLYMFNTKLGVVAKI